MPINRSWFNALVDDTGTGTTGTVWDKAAIAGLLDAIDGIFEMNKPWTPVLQFGGASTGWVINVAGARYARADSLILVEAQLTIGTVGSAAGIATIVGLPYPAATETSPLATIDPASGLAALTGATLGVYAGGIIYLVMQPPAAASGRVLMNNANFPANGQINFSMIYRRA